MINSYIEHYKNIVEEVKNSIESNMTHIDLFLLLCTQPISNGVMIKLNENNLSVISVNIHDNSTTNINQSEQVYYWVGKWLEFLKQHDIDCEAKAFDYIIEYQNQVLKYNIQARVEVVSKEDKLALSHFSIVLRIRAPENFTPLMLTLDSIHSEYINQKINNLNIHNKEDLQKNKL